MGKFEKLEFDEIVQELEAFFQPYQEPQFYSCEGSPLDVHDGRVVEIL